MSFNCYLYDESGTKLAYDDDGGSGLNFSIAHKLTAGATYRYSIGFYSADRAGDVSVLLTKESVGKTYRALFVCEPNQENPFPVSEANVQKMADMLDSVDGPQGGRYDVTTRKDLSPYGIRDAIKSTFADATEDDVSLFCISTRGNSGIDSGMFAGYLVTTGVDEGRTLEGKDVSNKVTFGELATWLKAVPGEIIVFVDSAGSGSSIYRAQSQTEDESELLVQSLVEAFKDAEADLLGVQTGALRKSGKFYVLTSSANGETSWFNTANNSSYFIKWLIEGVGTSGKPAADANYGDGAGSSSSKSLMRT